MAEKKLTASAVEALKPRQVKWDGGRGSIRGFGVRCQRRYKTFIVKYRVHAQQHIYTIGRLGDFTRKLNLPCTVENARKEAEWARGEVAAGRNPLDSVQRATSEDTVQAMVAEYLRRHVKGRGLRTADEIEQAFANHVIPEWRNRPLKTITRADVARLLDKIVDAGTPGAARNVRMFLSCLFKWAIGRGVGGIETSPVFAVPNPYTVTRRERVLNDAEIAMLWEVAEELDYPFGPFIKLALLLGQRRTEIGKMRWADIDINADGGPLWTIPGEANKAGRLHVVPLPPAAVKIIEAQDKVGPYVFTTHPKGARPISGFSKAKGRFDTELTKKVTKARARGVDTNQLFAEPWVLHDLRRTVATKLAELRVPRFVLGRVLNHSDPSVTGVYDRHAYLPEKREALNLWADKLARIARTGKVADRR